MALNLQRFVRQTEAFNSGALTVDDGIVNGPALYTYESADDTLAVITGAGYFDSQWRSLSAGDFFMITGTDSTGLFRVSAVDATLKTVTLVAFPAGAPVTTSGIANAAVTLPKLAAGIAPSHVVKYAGRSANAGGSATIAITVTGLLATDVVFADIQASTNAVEIQKVTATADTITVLLSAAPGAGTIISYQALRAAV